MQLTVYNKNGVSNSNGNLTKGERTASDVKSYLLTVIQYINNKADENIMFYIDYKIIV